MAHPREPRVHIQHDAIECVCPWCGEDLPEVVARWQSSERPDFSQPSSRTWVDRRGRCWHMDCADKALTEYGRSIVEKEDKETTL